MTYKIKKQKYFGNCWKKEYSSNKITRYSHINKPQQVEIAKERINGKDKYFVVANEENQIRDKEFDSKEKAVKFAKSYMKIHDDGC